MTFTFFVSCTFFSGKVSLCGGLIQIELVEERSEAGGPVYADRTNIKIQKNVKTFKKVKVVFQTSLIFEVGHF